MKTKRIPCPYCAELILPNAKKCRYCKENLNKSNKGISTKKIYYSWLISMLSFFVFIYVMKNNLSSHEGLILIAILLSILFGMVFFIGLAISLIRESKRKQSRNYLFLSVISFFLFFGILYNFDTVEASLGLTHKKTSNTLVRNTPVPTIKPTILPTPQPTTTTVVKTQKNNSGQIECIGPDGKKFITTMEDCKSLNEKWGKPVDYMINCNIHPDCGGGTEYMAKSECEKPCSGKNIKNEQPTIVVQENPTTGLDYYCYNNTEKYSYYTVSGEQCNKDNVRSACLSLTKSVYYDPCMDECLRDANDQSSYCIYNLSGIEQDECLEEKDSIHQSCMDSCGGIYEDKQKECY